jgi:hypothetical protein
VIPLSGRVPGKASRPSRSCIDDGGGLQYVSRKTDRVFYIFPSRGIYRRKGGVRKWTRGPHQAPAWPRGSPRHGVVRPPSGTPLSLLWTPSRFGKIETLAFVSSNSENISCVAFLKHKNSRNRELTLWHLISRLVLENAYKCHKV